MSSFLSLPREIRDQVYMLWIKPRVSYHEFVFGGYKAFKNSYRLEIFLLNRQINREASQIFYGNNHFAIEVDYSSPPIPQSLEALTRCSFRPWVRKLLLRITLDHLDVPPSKSRNSRCEQISKVLRYTARVLANGPKLDYLRIVYVEKPPSSASEQRLDMPLLDAFALLYGRVRTVKIDIRGTPEAVKLKDFGALQRRLRGQPAQPAFILHVPVEIRRNIYTYLVGSRSTQHGNHDPRMTTCQREDFPEHPNNRAIDRGASTFPVALFRTCRKIHKESTAYFYSELTWQINLSWWQPPKLPCQLVPSYAHFVTHFEMLIHLPNDFSAYVPLAEEVKAVSDVLSSSPRIKTLKVHTRVDTGPDIGIFDILRGLAPLSNLVEEVIVGKLVCRRERDEDAFHQLKDILCGVAKWSFPYADHQYKD